MPSDSCHALAFWVGCAQALYFILTGLWPLVSMQSFLKVTGAKTDLWLVQIVGLLVLIIGVVIAIATLRQSQTPEVIVLAMASAAGLAGADIYFVGRRTIPRIYLLDAAGEVALLVLWQWSLLCRT